MSTDDDPVDASPAMYRAVLAAGTSAVEVRISSSAPDDELAVFIDNQFLALNG